MSAWEMFVLITSIIYFMFGPIRQIAVFNLILGIQYVDEEGIILNYRYMFWIKVVIYLLLMVFPPIVIQLFYLNDPKRMCSGFRGSIWTKIPFIYNIPVFTGIFTSIKTLKYYKLKRNGANQNDNEVVLQVSQQARMIYQFTRIVVLMIILVVIWCSPNLKVLRLDHFAYMHWINAFDIVSLLWNLLLKLANFQIRTRHYPRWGENNAKKYGAYHPEHDNTYELEKLIGDVYKTFIIICMIIYSFYGINYYGKIK